MDPSEVGNAYDRGMTDELPEVALDAEPMLPLAMRAIDDHRAGRPISVTSPSTGDPLQVWEGPGTLVVACDGRVIYRSRRRTADDRHSLRERLRALESEYLDSRDVPVGVLVQDPAWSRFIPGVFRGGIPHEEIRAMVRRAEAQWPEGERPHSIQVVLEAAKLVLCEGA